MKTIIRKYRQSDRKSLIDCIGQLQDYIADLDPLHRNRTLKDFDATAYVSLSLKKTKENNGAIFIAEEKGEMIGCIIGAIYFINDDLEKYPETTGKIFDLYVAPTYRGKQVGFRLIQKMEQHFTHHGCSTISLECFAPNKDAYRFYMKVGYADYSKYLIKPIKKKRR